MASSIPLQPEVCLFFIFYVFERKYAFYDKKSGILRVSCTFGMTSHIFLPSCSLLSHFSYQLISNHYLSLL